MSVTVVPRQLTRALVPVLAVLAGLAALPAGLSPAAAATGPSAATASRDSDTTTRPARARTTRTTRSRPARRRGDVPARARLRREGRGRRHVTPAVRRWATPGRAPLTGTAPAPQVPGTPTSAPSTTDPVTPILADVLAPLSTAVGLRLDDLPSYLAVLSRLTAPAGTVRLQVRNDGEDPHDVLVERLGTGAEVAYLGVLAPGATTTRSLDLTAGDYRLLCTFAAPVDHSDAGMRATLTVTG